MRGFSVPLVLFSAVLHATWNAQLKSGNDRPQFMTGMSVVMGFTGIDLRSLCASARQILLGMYRTVCCAAHRLQSSAPAELQDE